MPAESKKQQRFFGMVHAVQKGDLSPSEVGPAVRKAAKNTDYSDAKDFASTKHKNLPEKVAGILDILAENKKMLLWEAATTAAIGAGVYAVHKPKSKKKIEKKGSLQMKYFEKQAKIRVEDIEDELHLYLDDPREKKVRKLIERETERRVGVRHPVLTGIPTLGIWPAVSKAKGVEAIKRSLLRGDSKLRKTHGKTVKDLRAYDLEMTKATAMPDAVSGLGAAYLLSKTYGQ
jgi:hypothetical protein